MTTTIDTRFFRAGVGTVIYNQKGEVALFERAQNPSGVWQFQQGGIDTNEHPEQTLWRELKEEVGLEKTDIITVTELPQWTIYLDEDAVVDPENSRLGQAHKWYFLELNPTSQIDLTKASDDEASNYRWTTFTEAINVTVDLKKHVYQDLEKYFLEHILPHQKTA